MNPRVITLLKTASILGGLCVAALATADTGTPPTWRLEVPHQKWEPEPKDYLVQIGVRVLQRPDSCFYVYTVANRSDDTLISIQIGYDSSTERCELTGAPPHAPPDTAYSPVGWECSPVQIKGDQKTFAVGWKVVNGLEETGGIPPKSVVSGFTVVLPKLDPLYELCHFRTPFKSLPFMSSIGRLMSEAELDIPIKATEAVLPIPITGTGRIFGRVTDEHGEGVPYANVIIKGTQLGGRGNAEGSYTILKVPGGRYTLSARSMGYHPRDKANVRVSENSSTKVDFQVIKAGIDGR